MTTCFGIEGNGPEAWQIKIGSRTGRCFLLLSLLVDHLERYFYKINESLLSGQLFRYDFCTWGWHIKPITRNKFSLLKGNATFGHLNAEIYGKAGRRLRRDIKKMPGVVTRGAVVIPRLLIFIRDSIRTWANLACVTDSSLQISMNI